MAIFPRKGRGSFKKLGTASEIKKQNPQKISGTFTEVSYLKMKLQTALQERVLPLWKNVDFTF